METPSGHQGDENSAL